MCTNCDIISIETLLNNIKEREEISNKIKIDKKEFLNGNIEEITKFVFVANPYLFRQKLRKIGIELSGDIENDSKILAELHNSGNDKNGLLVDKNGEKIIFSYLDLLKSIELSKKQLNKTKFLFV